MTDHTEGKPVRRGRPPFARNAKTLNEAALRDVAQASLDDDIVLLTPEKVAFTLQVHVATARDLMASGVLPTVSIPVKMGDIIRMEPRVSAQALVDWVDENTCGRVAAAQSGRS